MLLGCIGDDFTGSRDLANMLAKGGLRTMQYVGVPALRAAPDLVLALKSVNFGPEEFFQTAVAILTGRT